MALVYVETRVTLIYILSACEAGEFQSSLLQRIHLLGSGPRVCENVLQFLARAFTVKVTVGSSASCAELGSFPLSGTFWPRDEKL